MLKDDKTLAEAAMLAGMDEKTARRYRKAGSLPSQSRRPHTWRTRPDPFDEVWNEIEPVLKECPKLQAKALFEHLQSHYPGRFADGQLRTLQRRIKHWRATQGPPREVFFPQTHKPGELGASDFTSMNSLGITIAGAPFAHLFYHFVLTWSNWETGTIAFSESFESLSEGLQNALWSLGGAPKAHRSDQLTAAVQSDLEGRAGFTRRYKALLDHYGLAGRPTQPHSPHENGDAEQSHRRFKEAVEQELLLRTSRDFSSRTEYEAFLTRILERRNAGRREALEAERLALSPLAAVRLSSSKVLVCRVTRFSTIFVSKNTYSVPSRLIGEKVEVHLGAESLRVHYGGECVADNIPRVRGEKRFVINYRHVIDWLVRKPGAFENYQWKEDLFPTSRFRMAYDALGGEKKGTREYLAILELAARENESAVDEAIRCLIDSEAEISFSAVESLVRSACMPESPRTVEVAPVDLAGYDMLLGEEAVA
jgi:transposase